MHWISGLGLPNPARRKKMTAKTRKTMKTVGTTISVLLCVVLLPLLVFNLIIVLKGAINPDEVPSVFGLTPIVEATENMSENSSIKKNDLVIVRDLELAGSEAVGSVVAVLDENGTVRLVKIVDVATNGESAKYAVMADKDTAAQSVGADEIIGVMSARIALVGGAILFAHTPLGIVLFIGVPALAFVLYDVISKRRKPQAAAEEVTDEASEELCDSESSQDSSEFSPELTGETATVDLSTGSVTFTAIEGGKKDGSVGQIRYSEVVTRYEQPIKVAATTLKKSGTEK